MNPNKNKSRRSIEKINEKQKSEQSSDQSHCFLSIAFSLIKQNENNE